MKKYIVAISLLAQMSYFVTASPAKADVKEPTFFDNYVKEGKYNLDEIQSSISLITKLLSRATAENETADLLFKLGKLYTILANESAGTKDELSYRQKAISHFKRVIRDYKRFNMRGYVLYYLSQNLYRMGNQEEAKTISTYILKNFASYPFIDEVNLLLAEYYFDKGNYTTATKYYSETINKKKIKSSVFALYKIGKSFEKQSMYPKSHVAYKKSIEIMAKYPGLPQEYSKAMKGAALNSILFAYAETKDVASAEAFFKQYEQGHEYRTLMKTLGDMFDKKNESFKAVEVYKKILEKDPYHAENPKIHFAMIKLAEKIDMKVLGDDLAVQFISLYNPVSKWATTNKNNQDELNYAFPKVEIMLRNIAFTQYQNAVTANALEGYKRAYENYSKYIEYFPGIPYTYTARYYRANCEYQLDDFEKAKTHFTELVNLEGEFRLDSAYKVVVISGIQAYGKNFVLGQNIFNFRIDENANKVQPKEKMTIPEKETNLIAACDTYVDIAQLKDEFAKMLFLSGKIYYKYNHFDEANKKFTAIINQYERRELSVQAARLVLSSYRLQNDWTGLNTRAKEYIKVEKLAKGAFQEELAKIIEESTFNEIAELERQGKLYTAAEKYERFTAEFPNSTLSAEALYLAVRNYTKINEKQKMATIATALFKQYKDTKFAPLAIREVALYYDSITSFAQAASYYELLVKNYPADKDALASVERAGLLRESLRDYPKAIENYTLYLTIASSSKDVPQVKLKIAKLALKTNDKVLYDKTISELLINPDVMIAYTAAVISLENYFSDKDSKNALTTYQATMNHLKMQKADKKLLDTFDSEYAILEERRIYNDFSAMTIKGTFDEQKTELGEKEKLVKNAENYHKVIVNIRNDDKLFESYYRIGAMYKSVSKSIYEILKSAEAEDEKKFPFSLQSEFEDKALTLEDKAIKNFERAIEIAQTGDTISEWVRLATVELESYKPSGLVAFKDPKVEIKILESEVLPDNWFIKELP